MGKFFDEIPADIVPWLQKQELFWVATAPLSGTAHVNVSPKGVRDSFHVLSPTRVFYQDLSGSGVETIAHLRERDNGRITLMFSAFDGPPRIVRLFGTGTVHEFGTPEYDALIPPESRRPGSRAAIVVDVHKVGTSCGYAVPYYEFKGHRQVLLSYWIPRERKDQEHEAGYAEKGLKSYWHEKNRQSIDGLPGLDVALSTPCVPVTTETMKHANNAPFMTAQTTKGSRAVWLGGRRVREWVVAFVLGMVFAVMYAQVSQVASRMLIL